jgi:hypothetical protein
MKFREKEAPERTLFAAALVPDSKYKQQSILK